MKEKAISEIKSYIWAVEHMDSKSGSKALVNNNYGRAQGVILLAYSLELITKEEYDIFWDEASQACYNNASYWSSDETGCN